jgi:uncharacterized protein (DUF1810 family)
MAARGAAPGLERFLAAQEGVYDRALDELRAGRKTSHWMWFIFPQLRGLGRSETARFYGLDGVAEAQAYLAHPVLGARLVEAARAMLTQAGQRPEAVLGATDAMKLRSSATLFAAVPGADPVFARLIEVFYGGAACPLTRERLGA